MGIAFVGVGYVADLYVQTLRNWTELLDLRGVFDRRGDRLATYAAFHGVPTYDDLDAVLADPAVEIVVNLTNPDQHHEITGRALAAGKHVYSEKPLALTLDGARELVAQADAAGRHVVSAPSSLLGEAAQTLRRAVVEQVRGRPRLVYAEMDDGLVHRIGYQNWRTRSGAPWPAEDEFRTGCTLEHAGYSLTWLVGLFGPVRHMVTGVGLLIPDKGPDTPEPYATPDFSCAVLRFDDGVMARLTNSIVAPHDHRFRVFCDDGVLEVDETWDFSAQIRSVPVADSRARRLARKTLGWDGGRVLKPVHRRRISTARRGYHMDFALGVAEMAQAIRAGRVPRLAGEFSLHITEVSLAMQHPERFGAEYVPRSAPGPVASMLWDDGAIG
ncbi:Gfo/Idh/MocA family protein [Jannaschia sp. W003]|uniref:Gfo/Idh/MocA family protein n=1 Tax=Jannaschia sp. W003 TaxID=2867012 RepID=UPI0021A9339B|nr:Gfo/Idh/MocA family oxidoreductase [Jannaschia sp. W003]UWQ21555.1 Gfo/Idh/MocA family oxidoreductase [Jannaschia sp. W003]